jgi:hypothetical protein
MRVVLLVAVLAQLLACHAVVSASTAALGPAVVQDAAPGESRGGEHGPRSDCEPAGTAPFAGTCRDAGATAGRPSLPDSDVALALLALLMAAAASWSRWTGSPQPCLAGRRRLLALEIIRV